MTDLSELIERVEKATGPDRELDAAIAAHFDLPYGPRPVGGSEWLSAHFTASVDAALELVERELPGWRPNVWLGRAGWDAEIEYPEPRREDGRTYFAIRCDKPMPNGALAIILALLRAKQETGE